MFFSKVDQNYFYLQSLKSENTRLSLCQCYYFKPRRQDYLGQLSNLFGIKAETGEFHCNLGLCLSNHSCANSSHLEIRDWDRNTNPLFFNYLHFGKKKTKSMRLVVIERSTWAVGSWFLYSSKNLDIYYGDFLFIRTQAVFFSRELILLS